MCLISSIRFTVSFAAYLPYEMSSSVYFILSYHFWGGLIFSITGFATVSFLKEEIMDIKKLAGIGILIFVFLVGCSVTNGKIGKQTGTAHKVTLAELRDNWDDYDIYYGMRSNRYADAIMFDPKNNSTKLSGNSWIKIEDQETLDEKIKELQSIYDYAKVHIIKGENNQVFGYMYYPTYLRVPVRIVDERALYVSSLPPYKSAP
jgi:hypothetical protein